MAKNLLDQILTISGLKGSDTHCHTGSQGDSSGLSGVERYLRKQAEAEQQAEEELTGVAKYLAQRAKEEEENVAVEEAQATGVEKYLAKQASVTKEKVTTPAKATSRVDQYLAKQSAAEKKAGLPERRVTSERRQATTKPAAKKGSATKKKPVAQKAKVQPKPVNKEASKLSSGIINRSEGATQCQAATTKGTQCRRDTGLTSLERTIDKQKYRFAVCNQHKNQAFKPFSELI